MSAAQQPRIVVIDDDDAVSDAIRLLMQMCGWEASTYRCCEDFIEDLDRDKLPACMVLDVYFRGMSGVDLQKYLAEEGIEIPTIILTAWPDGTLASLAAETGAIEVMIKPASSDQLIRVIEGAITSAYAEPAKH